MKGETWYLKLARALMPLGMAAALLYVLHAVLGAVLWPEYNSIADPISLLTAESSPHAAMLRVLSGGFGVCQLLFATSILITAFSGYGSVIRAGTVCYFLMSIVTLVGLFIFPLADGARAGAQNSLHTLINTLVVTLIMVSMYLVSIGFFAFENMRAMGIATLTAALGMAVFGVVHSLVGALGVPVQGLTERLSLVFYYCFVFVVSFAYTFNTKMVQRPEKPAKKPRDKAKQ